MGKTLSIFIDESGDVGFIKDASKYYIITFVNYFFSLIQQYTEKNLYTSIATTYPQQTYLTPYIL